MKVIKTVYIYILLFCISCILGCSRYSFLNIKNINPKCSYMIGVKDSKIGKSWAIVILNSDSIIVEQYSLTKGSITPNTASWREIPIKHYSANISSNISKGKFFLKGDSSDLKIEIRQKPFGYDEFNLTCVDTLPQYFESIRNRALMFVGRNFFIDKTETLFKTNQGLKFERNARVKKFRAEAKYLKYEDFKKDFLLFINKIIKEEVD